MEGIPDGHVTNVKWPFPGNPFAGRWHRFCKTASIYHNYLALVDCSMLLDYGAASYVVGLLVVLIVYRIVATKMAKANSPLFKIG